MWDFEDSKMAANEDVPVHYALPVLHPTRMNGAKWFKHNTKVSTRVRKIIKGCFKGPWYSWKKVPQFYRDAWFSTFETKYQWEGAIDNLVRANFEKLTATRLKGMVSLAKSNASKPNGGKPEWILSEDWRVMLAYWRTPRAKATSEKACLSRLSNRNGLGPHRHRAGSRSYAKVQDVLEANNEDSSFIAVLKRTHQKPDGTFVDERARIISEKYDFEVQEYLSQMDGEGLTIDSLTLEEKNKIYSKIVEQTKQGWRYGLGSLQSEVLMSSETSPISPQVNKEVETLTSQVKELETELQKSRDENANFKNRLDALEDFLFEPGSRR